MGSMHLILQNSRDAHSCIGNELYHSCKTSSSHNKSPNSANVWKRTQHNSLKSLKLQEGYVLGGQGGLRWLSNSVSGRMFHWTTKEWGWQTWKLPKNESYLRAETENQKWFYKCTSFKETEERPWDELRINTLLCFKVIPEFCIAHSYCARFLRHQRAHMSARAYKT